MQREPVNTAFQQDIRLVGHKSERMDARARSFCKQSHAIHKLSSGFIVTDETPLLDPPDEHVVQSSRRIKSR